MRFGMISFVIFATVIAAVNHVSPFFPVQASPVQQFGSCFDQPVNSDAYTRCVSEHFQATDRYIASAMNQVGVGMISNANIGR